MSVRLTKSRFIQALSCPTKLFYAADKVYANQSIEDPFLAALAEGGFQVGELAKCYFPGGIEINSINQNEAVEETKRLLQQKNVILFEAAIKYENCLVRVDVLVKKGNLIELHEVKSKSFDGHEEAKFLKRDGKPKSEWKKYLYELAFQKWVVKNSFSKFTVSAYLMLIDRSQYTATIGLNQKFPIVTDAAGRKRVIVDDSITPEDLRTKLLLSVNVDLICSDIYEEIDHGLDVIESFDQMVARLSAACEEHMLIDYKLGKHCKVCEFIATENDLKEGKLDGRIECFKRKMGTTSDIFDEPTVLDLWNYRNKDKLIESGIIRLSDVTEDDIKINKSNDGLSLTERQWKQVEKAKHKDDTIYIDKKGLQAEMETWNYPLHFIDFETAMVALPFGANRHPYEGIAFQFSHHIVEIDGSIRHAGQFLNAEPGHFPNYDFARALKYELETDQGSIFIYSGHENTYLNLIIDQLECDACPPNDKDALITFFKEITHSKNDSILKWQGKRDMVDLLDVVKKYYFDPRTKGSNSIKHVLPAILSRSSFLQKKYGTPIYGASDGIPSLNFKNWKWVEYDENGIMIDPYEKLPKLFSDKQDRQIEILSESDSLANGGAAMMAYARMQFEKMSDYECKELSNALFMYCELDTLAMVMIYEAWKDIVD